MDMQRLAVAISAAAGAFVPLLCGAQELHPADPVQVPVRYDGHRCVQVTVSTPRQLLTVLALTDDVLTCHGAGIGSFDVRFSPEQYAAFLATDIPHEVFIEDLQVHLDQWRAGNERIRQQDGPGWYEAFRDLAEIEARLEHLADAHPDLATLSVIGESVENRPISMIRITGPGPAHDRPAFVINGTQHAREALSPMTTMFFAEHLLTAYDTDPRIRAAVDSIDFHIVPVMNPDGYVWARTVAPMWRKNRRINPNTTCHGVDLNRNWAFGWGNPTGSSNNPCSETFHGAGPFSEPEAQAMAAVLDALGNEGRLRAHFDFHGSAQALLSPWGYSRRAPWQLPLLTHLGAMMRDAIAQHRGTMYQNRQGFIYLFAGNAADYSYKNHGTLSWTLEPAGGSFYPPPAQIIPVSTEITLGLLSLADVLVPRPTAGACCILSQCILVTAADCAAVGGDFRGTGTYCASAACEILHGACCYAGTCIQADASECAAAEGDFRGIGTRCQEADCPRRLQASFPNSDLGRFGGIFVDLSAGDRPIDIFRFDYHTTASGTWPTSLQVYTFPGSYVGNDHSSTGWTLHEQFVMISSGYGALTPRPLEMPIHVPAGQTVGIYLVAVQGGFRCLQSTGQTTWTDGDLTLFTDRARLSPWGGSPLTDRRFSGAIHYAFADSSCYANCDNSTSEPILNVDDFTCFINAFAAAQSLPHEQQVAHYANCDRSVTPPVLTVDDFACFINEFALGCP